MSAESKLLPSSLGCSTDVTKKAVPSPELEEIIEVKFQELLGFAKQPPAGVTFMAFEKGLFVRIQDVGRLLILLFLTVHEAHLREQMGFRVEKAGRQFVRRPAHPRSLNTTFGVVRYFRSYFRGTDGSGFHPLDVALSLTADRITMTVLARD